MFKRERVRANSRNNTYMFRILEGEEVDTLVEEGEKGLYSISFTSSLHTDTIRNYNININVYLLCCFLC